MTEETRLHLLYVIYRIIFRRGENMRYASVARILYIDSQQSSHEINSMLRHAENSTYCISTANTPTEALELIASEPFDLFILEHRLPEMSGVELCRQIRKTDKQTPILFFTARTRLAESDVSLAAGATEYLVEPVSAEYLLETVRRLLRDFHAAKPKNQSSCCLAK
jgi:two-component system, OmpR family, copper resistance phosphate regulon response regulator CusR